MSDRPLLQRYPTLRSTTPWLQLAELPTPVEQIVLDDRTFWIKRDDLTSPAYGGNKVRKLEFILGEARRRRATRVITVGAAGSHHALATTVFARSLGMDTTLVLFPQAFTPHVREVLLADATLGAEVRYTGRMATVPTALAAARIAHWSARAFVIPAGGSDPLGTLGYVNAALELGEQVDAGLLPAPEVIVLPAGTLGTTAGVALGLSIANLPTRIHATRITSRVITNDRVLRKLIADTAALLQNGGVQVDAHDAIARVHLSHDQIGPGYGVATEAGEAAAAEFATHGVHTDPTYASKAAADLMTLPRDQRVLFWHTLSAITPPFDPEAVRNLPPQFQRYVSTTTTDDTNLNNP